MTRFARAKGSKASNERLPEQATSWSDMKKQLEAKLKEVDEEKNRKQAEAQRRANYNAFLEEHEDEKLKNSSWAEFSEPNTEKRANNKKKRSHSESGEELEIAEKKDEDLAEPKMKQKKIKKKADDNGKIETIVTAKKGKKKNKLPKNDVETKNDEEEKKELQKNDVASKNDEEGKTVKKKKNKLQKKDEESKNAESDKKVNLKPSIDRKPQHTAVDSNEKTFKQNNQKFDKQNKRKREFGDKFDAKRRKPDSKQDSMIINGIEVAIGYYDGFPIKKEDCERLNKLKKQMISKGLPRSEIQRALKLERRRAEKALARERKKVCFNCRKAGHVLSECPSLNNGNTLEISSGICFKCGSTEHTHFECKVVKKLEYKFATCFICREQGHISNQCPDNPRGVYPKGGACKICGDVTHLKKDCPKYQAEQEESTIKLDKIDSNVEALDTDIRTVTVEKKKKTKVVKF